MTAPHGIVCSTPVYEFKGWTFEFGYTGCWPLRKDGELRKRAGRKFFAMVDEFAKLPKKQQEACRVGGGCVRF